MPKKPIVAAKVETETLLALATSDTVTEAAERLGIARNSLYERIHKYGLTEKLKDIQNAAAVELLTSSGKAARKIGELVDHKDPNIAIKAATENLDRIGITKANNNSQVNINFNQIVKEQRERYGD